MSLYLQGANSPNNSRKDSGFSPDLSLPDIQRWLESLPITNHEKTAQLLGQALTQVHNADLADQKHLEILNLFEPTLETVCFILQQNFLANLQLPLKKAADANNQAQALQLKLASEYLSLILQPLNQLSQEHTITAIHRAIKHIGLAVLWYFQQYSPIPKHLWHKLHSAYLYAEVRGWEKVNLIDTNEQLTTISSEYIRILLLALAGPYQLSRPETEQVYYSLSTWTEWVTLEKNLLKNSLHIVCLDKEQAPLCQTLLANLKPTTNWRLINTQTLINHLKNLLQDPTRHDIGEPVLAHTLIQHLLRAWGNFSARKFVRLESAGDMKVVIGLAGTNYFIDRSQPNLYQPSFLKSAAEEMFDPWQPIYVPAKNSPSLKSGHDLQDTKQAVTTAQPSKRKTAEYTTQPWQLINSSTNGYCLSTMMQFSPQITVGDIVGLQNNADESAPWQVGAVQWMTNNEDEHLQIGINLLATAATAIFLRRYPQQPYLRGLLLPAQPELSQAMSLLIPVLFFQTGDKLDIAEGDKHYSVKLTALIRTSTHFKQFLFELIETDNKLA